MCVRVCVRALCVLCVVLPPSPASRPHELAAQTQATPESPSEPLSMPGTTGWGRQVGGGSGPGPRLGRGLGDARSGACTAVTRVRGNRSWRRAPWVTAVTTLPWLLDPSRNWPHSYHAAQAKRGPKPGPRPARAAPSPLTSIRRGSRVTRCMGRIRKEIMGRPPHAGRFSISRRTSRKAALLLLPRKRGVRSAAARAGRHTRSPPPPAPRPGTPARDPGPAHVSRCRARCW